MSRDRFVDPATGEDYPWPRNHDVETSGRRQRAVTELQPTAAGWQQVRSIRQQGADSPLVIRLEGQSIRDMHETFLRFWATTAQRTVHFISCHGERYEVLIVSYEPQRRGVVRTAGGRDHTRRYTMELEVVAQLA